MTPNNFHQYKLLAKFHADRHIIYITVEHDGHDSAKKKKKKEEVQSIESDEEDNALEESRPDSSAGGGGDEVNQEEGGEEGDKKEKDEVTPLKDPLTEAETSKKRMVSP
jgi:hypothetical protein